MMSVGCCWPRTGLPAEGRSFEQRLAAFVMYCVVTLAGCVASCSLSHSCSRGLWSRQCWVSSTNTGSSVTSPNCKHHSWQHKAPPQPYCTNKPHQPHPNIYDQSRGHPQHNPTSCHTVFSSCPTPFAQNNFHRTTHPALPAACCVVHDTGQERCAGQHWTAKHARCCLL